ncbi:hypothetical protein EPA93_38950 [Ktedonosporobacter rubrisoli]|uniref:Uncharacterized protein n=1 Tax=Ktedonosporobacter rubrisoli TaxID=2509675 RepID=A0A4P6K1D3_KTERU|nr:hypothetical protein [Ktedonosporobacter rubrisoli]QBD81632.1 hypothetical protein EPA93_38950 [Ktedonosporobacter rubrisoli]
MDTILYDVSVHMEQGSFFVYHDLEAAIALGDRALFLGTQGLMALDEPITLLRPLDAIEIRFHPEFTELHRRLWNDLMQVRTQQDGKV